MLIWKTDKNNGSPTHRKMYTSRERGIPATNITSTKFKKRYLFTGEENLQDISAAIVDATTFLTYKAANGLSHECIRGWSLSVIACYDDVDLNCFPALIAKRCVRSAEANARRRSIESDYNVENCQSSCYKIEIDMFAEKKLLVQRLLEVFRIEIIRRIIRILGTKR